MCGAVKLNYCNKCFKLTNFRILSFTAYFDCVWYRTEMYFTSNESIKTQLSIEVQHISVSVLFLELLAKMCGAVKLNYCYKCNKLTNFRILSFTAPHILANNSKNTTDTEMCCTSIESWDLRLSFDVKYISVRYQTQSTYWKKLVSNSIDQTLLAFVVDLHKGK